MLESESAAWVAGAAVLPPWVIVDSVTLLMEVLMGDSVLLGWLEGLCCLTNIFG